MVTSGLHKAFICSLAVLLVASSAQAARPLPYPAASNAKDIPTLDQLSQFPVGIDRTSNPPHYVTTSSCFPSGAQVQTPAGARSIELLRLGDQVLTVQPSGKAVFEEVFMFSHQDAKQCCGW
ncbi:hypothetical protein WJX84_007277 [Apatococcus fuscideae]|uniref:Hedgehog protein Hint domain-containing protein n=1 Tax=Apatococcus fuscideae TaxID=2026836 RepID=A0AAW1SLY0_9CHLO